MRSVRIDQYGGGILRDADILLPFGGLAWPQKKPRARKIGKTVHAVMIAATKNRGDGFCAVSPSTYLKSLNRSFST